MSDSAVSYPGFPAPAEPVREPAYFVAVNGHDSWSGRLAAPNADGTDGPLASLERARDLMRATSIDVTYVRGGTYRLGRTLDLTSADNGVAFLGYPGETAVISGGERVTGFRNEGNGLFSAALGRATDLDLVIGGSRQRVAQSGDWDAANPAQSGWLVAEGAGSKTALKFRPGDVRPGDITAGTKIQTFNTDRLADSIVEVAGVDFATNTITFKSPVWYQVQTGGTYRLLNSPALLRDAGEFVWRGSDNRLVVKPENPAAFEQEGVVVPRLGTLVRMTGTSGATLFGLTFAETPLNGNTVEMIGANGNRVGGNRFVNAGNGLRMAGSSGNTIDGNVMEHLAGTGVDLSGRSNDNAVTGNLIRNVGEIAKYVSGISGNGIDRNRFSHNEIDGSPSYGISIKDWNANNANTGNVIEHNRITRTGLETADTAGIEMLGRSNNNAAAVIRGNRIDGVTGLATSPDGSWVVGHKSFGIYLDDQTNGVTVTDNFIRGTGWASVFVHGGDNNRVTNNFSVMRSNREEMIRVEWVPSAGDAGLPRNNAITGNIAYGAVPVDDYWELYTAGQPTISGNLVHNSPAYGSSELRGDPLFVNPALDDFRLGAGSPAFGLGIHDLPWGLMGRNGYVARNGLPPLLPAAPASVTITPVPTGGGGGGGGSTGGATILPVPVPMLDSAQAMTAGMASAGIVHAAASLGVGEPGLAAAMGIFAERVGPGGTITMRTVQPRGAVALGGDAATALLIDGRSLPAGTPVQIDHAGFAALIGPVRVTGGAGDNRFAGFGGTQTVFAGVGNDTAQGGDDLDQLFGNMGADLLMGNAGADQLFGGRDGDQLYGGRDNDALWGDDGADVILGDPGEDTAWGGGDGDALSGGDGGDRLFGNMGTDLLMGNMGADQLFGGLDSDTLYGGLDADALFGDDGTDRLSGDAGNDTLTGGTGADVFVFATGGGADVVNDFNAAEGDRIGLAAGRTYTVSANGAGAAVIVFADGDSVTLIGVRREQFSSDWLVFG